MLQVLRVEMVINSPWMLFKNWLVRKQTDFGKDISNPFMADNLPKIVWFSTHHITCMKKLASPKQTALGKGLLGPRGGRCGGNDGRGGSIARRGEGRFSKRSIDSNDGRGRGGLPVLGSRSSRESKSACREVGRVEKMSSTRS
uniref:Uncharacterized protein n=1 Tax=Tanacetum cinerariifolium TaxID=118510 RepID=A0A6L2JEQ8_TANCI|nr:hypothetical protein [Tanacetum cinerariifolium]